MPQLSVPLFVTESDVAERLQLQDQLTGAVGVIESAIMGSQLAVERLLGGTLCIKQRTCNFFLDADAFSGMQPGGFFRLEIPSGFVRNDYSVSVVSADNWQMNNSQTLTADQYQVDYDRGYILVDAGTLHGNWDLRFYSYAPYSQGQYRNKFVQVTCTTGFKPSVPTPSFTGTASAWDAGTAYTPGQAVTIAVSGGTATYLCVADCTGVQPPNTQYWTPVSYGPEQIPQAVYEAVMTYVPLLLNSDQSTNRNPQAKPQYQTLTDHCMMLLRDYIRMKGFSFRPSTSTYTDVTS